MNTHDQDCRHRIVIAPIHTSMAPHRLKNRVSTLRGFLLLSAVFLLLRPSPVPVEKEDVIQLTIDKWGLTSPQAYNVLQEELHREPVRYDAETDFLFFEHIRKTGGTTLSLLLKSLMGDHVFPGSDEGAIFHFNVAEEAVRNGTLSLHETRVGYAHATARGGNKLEKLLTNSTRKRLRVLTVIRDPVNIRASLLGMSLCQYKAWIRQYNEVNKLPPDYCDVSLDNMVDVRVESVERLCEQAKKMYGSKVLRNTGMGLGASCKELEKGRQAFGYCRSIPALLNSSHYEQGYHHMYRDIIAEKGDDDEARGLLALSREFLWIGITERMDESLRLLFTLLNVASLPSLKSERVVNCRPTQFWSEGDKAVVREREGADYAVYRAANALLDIRLYKLDGEEARINMKRPVPL